MRESVERETVERGENHTAQSRKRNGFIQNLDRVTTSFFITNFPEDSSSEQLWELFRKFGRVGEVYIPKKLDKWGRRFGFVKFKDVLDVEVLSRNLRDVWLGSFKLRVNLSRFGRSDSKDGPSKTASIQRPPAYLEEVQPGRSFRTAVLGATSIPEESQVLKIPVNEALCKELQGSMVGTLAREKDVRRIQTTLFMEGFKTVSVTHMGDNLALLRSSVEGDVERMFRSRKECLGYYFSELKPWNPGLFAIKREVWIQVFGIPLHVWGEVLFKKIGDKLGVFLDFDEETASMARFDVARIKILSTTWALIDVEMKLEVEGEEVEVVGSLVVPSEASDAEDDGYVAGPENSGEDEASGNEVDVDVTKISQYGGRLEVKGDLSMYGQVLKERDISLTYEKSTYFSNSHLVILSELPAHAGNKETEKAPEGAVSGEGGNNDKCLSGGSGDEVEAFKVVVNEGGPGVCNTLPQDLLGLVNSFPEPQQSGHLELGLIYSDPAHLGLVDCDLVRRLSSISEPEEALSSHRIKDRNPITKIKRQKSCSKINKLALPMCLQMVEAGRDEMHSGSVLPCVTPPSGINLLSNSETSKVLETALNVNGPEKEKLLEAAKLLSIQKEVGFSFEEAEDAAIKQLIDQERSDRAKKMAWEQREGDQ
ncbi:RNA recognition motif [Trifolium medium]|uniref:RNA recognition motif n=1 Tax=Trifolium medium TaxID=97028 RepID=A0A392M537_9FABA|nr:RNA recognition motif [Trifolium medium]